MKKEDVTAIVTASLQKAEELTRQRKAALDACKKDKEALTERLRKLEIQRISAAEIGDEDKYSKLCDEIRGVEDKLRFAEIRAIGLEKNHDPELGESEFRAMKEAFESYEKEILAEAIGLLDTYGERMQQIDMLWSVAGDAGLLWKRIAGDPDSNVTSYTIPRGPVPFTVSPDQMRRAREYLGA